MANEKSEQRMNPEVKAKWVAALRSGNYKQGQFALRNAENQFCCLGVLCNLHAEAHPDFAATQTNPRSYDGSRVWPTPRVLAWAGLGDGGTVVIDGEEDCAAGHNDNGKTFAEIADAIEEQL